MLIPITIGPLDYAIALTVSLDGIEITLRLRWLPRCSGWYLTIEDSDGTVVSTGRRVCTGSPLIPDRTLTTLPPGQIVARGAVDLTRREYLGGAVQLLYLTADEWSQVVTPAG